MTDAKNAVESAESLFAIVREYQERDEASCLDYVTACAALDELERRVETDRAAHERIGYLRALDDFERWLVREKRSDRVSVLWELAAYRRTL